MLGTDEEGKAVRNEYGEMVGMASQIGGAMSAKKGADAAKKLEMQSLKDDAMQTRLDNLDPTGTAGREFAMNRSRKDADNLKALQAGQKGSLGGLFQKDIEGINYEPTTVGDWEMPPKPTDKVTHTGGPPSLQTPSGESAIKPSAIEGPKWSPSVGSSKTPTSAAQKFESQGSPLQAKHTQEQNELISRLTGGMGHESSARTSGEGVHGGMPAGEIGDRGKSREQLEQEDAIRSWTSNPRTLTPDAQGRKIKITGKWGEDCNRRQAAQNAIQPGSGGQ